KLLLFSATDAVFEQPGRQLRQQLFAVMGPVRAAQLVLGDVAADEPVAKRQANIDGTACLGGQFLVDAADRENKVLQWAHRGNFGARRSIMSSKRGRRITGCAGRSPAKPPPATGAQSPRANDITSARCRAGPQGSSSARRRRRHPVPRGDG